MRGRGIFWETGFWTHLDAIHHHVGNGLIDVHAFDVASKIEDHHMFILPRVHNIVVFFYVIEFRRSEFIKSFFGYLIGGKNVTFC